MVLQSWAGCWSDLPAGSPPRRWCNSHWHCEDCSPRSGRKKIFSIFSDVSKCRNKLVHPKKKQKNTPLTPVHLSNINIKDWNSESFTGKRVFYLYPTILSALTSPRWESPRGPLVSGLTMMTLTPGRIFEENTEEALASALVQTTVLTSVGVWSEWPPHKCLLLDNNQYLQFLTPWVEDSVALLAPPASPWETNTAIS